MATLLDKIRERAVYEPATIPSLSELRPGTDAKLEGPGTVESVLGKVARVVGVRSDFAVYVDALARIRYFALPVNGASRLPEFNLAWNQVLELEFVLGQLRETHSDAQLDIYRTMLGNAVVAGLCGDIAAMRDALARTKKLLEGKVARNAKQVYVITAIRMALILIVVAGLGVSVTAFIEAHALVATGTTDWMYVVVLGVLGGAMGALFSILTAGHKPVPFDPVSSADYAMFEARTRLVMGVLAGVIVGICQATGIVASTLMAGIPKSAGILILAVVGGFAERLVPSLLLNKASDLAPSSGEADASPNPSPVQASELGSAEPPADPSVETPSVETPSVETPSVEAGPAEVTASNVEDDTSAPKPTPAPAQLSGILRGRTSIPAPKATTEDAD